MDSNQALSGNLQMQYLVSKSQILVTNLQASYHDNELQTTLQLIWIQSGYVLKLPIHCANQINNLPAIGISLGIFGVINLACFWALNKKQSKKPMFERIEYVIAFNNYNKHLEKLQQYLTENQIFINRKLKQEQNGLLIVEAYYGLQEHIYQIDAGKLFKLPSTVKEYYEC